MNEKRFIVLLNLYIDGEISSEEQEELEHEVANNIRRRRIFQNYCLLQRASKQVCSQFGQALTQTVDLKKYQVLARSSTRCCLWRGLLYSTGALAAACLTVVAAVAVFNDSQREPYSSSARQDSFGLVEVLDPSALNGRRAEASTTSASFIRPEPFIFAGRSHTFGRTKRRAAFLESNRSSFQVSANPSVWESELPAESPAPVFRSGSSFETSSELTSFQFQR